jgi:hypothetical protein
MTDLLDEIDERLAVAGRRWQAEQPPPPAVPVDRLDEPLSRHGSWRVIAAVAATVVLVGGGAVAAIRVAGGDPHAGPSDTSSSPTPQVLRVKPVVPWRDIAARHPKFRQRVHGQVVTPYDRVSATGTISGHLHPGDTLTFTAVLQSPTNLPLDPCPDFNLAFGRHSWHTRGLNCAQVPYQDGKGRPVLPAFKNVRFEMKVTVPDEIGRQKVLWTLDGPQQMPGFYGIVDVTAS